MRKHVGAGLRESTTWFGVSVGGTTVEIQRSSTAQSCSGDLIVAASLKLDIRRAFCKSDNDFRPRSGES